MDKKTVIKNTEVFVKGRLADEPTGHDFWHIVRVLNNAKEICKNEKADWHVIHLALLLHDVGDRKIIKTEHDDYSIARNFLTSQKVPSETIEKVMFIIENMSFSKSLNSKIKNPPIEFQIVQDSDRLDSIGAMGIARVFAFGGNRARPLWDPTIKIKKPKSTEAYKKLQTSSLHHFYEKLFSLKDFMNTKTAKKIAEKRHKFMKNYVEEFLSEWEGKR